MDSQYQTTIPARAQASQQNPVRPITLTNNRVPPQLPVAVPPNEEAFFNQLQEMLPGTTPTTVGPNRATTIPATNVTAPTYTRRSSTQRQARSSRNQTAQTTIRLSVRSNAQPMPPNSHKEKRKVRRPLICYRCREPGHKLRNCPLRRKQIQRDPKYTPKNSSSQKGPEIPEGTLLSRHFRLIIKHRTHL